MKQACSAFLKDMKKNVMNAISEPFVVSIDKINFDDVRDQTSWI
jgi:hypothetical protein